MKFTLDEIQHFYPKYFAKVFAPAQKKIKHKRAAGKPVTLKAAPGLIKIRPNRPKTFVRKPRVIKPKVAKKEKKVKEFDNSLGKQERIMKNNSKLLQQLLFLDKRMKTMQKDLNKYQIVEFEKTGNRTYKFVISKDDIPDHNKIIRFSEQNELTCNCPDWEQRCHAFSVPCKHIYFLLEKVLGYKLFDFFDNTITNPEEFLKKVEENALLKSKEKKEDIAEAA